MDISPKALAGIDGFLFLNGLDANELLDYFQGAKTISSGALHVHRHNKSVIGNLDIPFVGIIVPEAHVMYPEKLPKDITIVADRPLTRSIAEMAHGYIYAYEILSGFKARGGTVYTGRDSHWTQTAALETYMRVRHRLGKTEPFVADYNPSNANEVGDLAAADVQAVIAAEMAAQRESRHLGFHSVFANGILNQGNISVTFNPARQGRCLAFGTSFSTRLVPAYASDFAETVFCYGTTVDPLMVNLVQPDCVICELPERFLHFPSLAVEGSTLLSMVIAQRAQAHPSPPRNAPAGKLSADLVRLCAALVAAPTDASGVPGALFMTMLEQSAPQLAWKLALLAPLLVNAGELTALRLAIGGQFCGPGYVTKLAIMADERVLTNAHLPLLPPSQAGLLTRIRILIRAGLFIAAGAEIGTLINDYGRSDEASYYHDFVGRMIRT